MSADWEGRIARWAASAIESRWPGARFGQAQALKGDASSRRFWRVSIVGNAAAAPPTAIIVDLGPDDLPRYARELKLFARPLAEAPFINVHRFLRAIGSAVPEIYCAARAERILMAEDVGDRPLLGAAAQSPARAASLFRRAIDELLILHLDGTRRRDSRCVAFGIAYDARLFAWEMEPFISLGLEVLNAANADFHRVGRELHAIAKRLDGLPRVLSHRDYHGHNLFVQNHDRIRVIDFQDALMAPAVQDLAVLLTTRATASIVTPEMESELLAYYHDAALRRGETLADFPSFVSDYRMAVLQHALKAFARFIELDRAGKTSYRQYLPHCLAQARRILALQDGFPALRQALGVQ